MKIIEKLGGKVRLINGECIEAMSEHIPDGSIDLTVTSPPYDNLRSYNGQAPFTEDVWKGVLNQLYRVTKTGGVVVWVVGDATIKGSETGTSFKQALYAKEIGFNLHDTMIYRRHSKPQTHNRYEQHFEYMFIFSKGKPNKFNAIKVPCKKSGKTMKSWTIRKHGDELSKGKAIVINPTKNKNNVWEYAVGLNGSTTDKIAFKHPAIFPEKLALDHIRSWSNYGDVVFDPFLGSGTTGKMAMNTGRRFVGIELDEGYFEIACKRIDDAIHSTDVESL